jgi:hypothetical protein
MPCSLLLQCGDGEQDDEKDGEKDEGREREKEKGWYTKSVG